MRIWINILALLLFSCGNSKMYQNAAQVVKIERDTVYISQTDWERVKQMKARLHSAAKENYLLRVEIDQLKKKIALMEIRYVIEKKSK